MSSSTIPACYLFAQCNAMVDLVADVDDEFIATTKGLVRGQAQLAESDEQVRRIWADACARSPKKPRITPGGSGLATARCVNWILQENNTTSSPVSVLSVINEEDEHGKLMKESLSSEGVDTSCLVSLPSDPPRATGVCLVLVTPDGERTMLVTIGAWQNLDIFDKVKNDPVASAELMASQPALSISSQVRSQADIQYATGFAVVASGAFLLHSSLGFNNSASTSRNNSTNEFEEQKKNQTSSSPPASPLNCRFCNGSPHHQKKDQILAGNISAQYVVDAFNESLIEFLTEADLVFSNFEEAKALALSIVVAEKKNTTSESADESAEKELKETKSPCFVAEFLVRFFLTRRSRSAWRCGGCVNTHNDATTPVATITVVVTNGSEDIGICSGGSSNTSFDQRPDRQVIQTRKQSFVVPPLSKDQKIVDTCNAGDCFVGGFFAGMKLFHELEKKKTGTNLSVGAAWHCGIRHWLAAEDGEESKAFSNWLSQCVLLGTKSAAVVICQSGCTLPKGSAPRVE